MMTTLDRLSADLARVRWIGVLGMLTFCIAAAMSWRDGDMAVAILFVVFAALGLYLWLSWGHIAADHDVVTVSNAVGVYQLAWQDVRKVEASAYGTLVLHAHNARLVLPPPLLWSGPHKQALRALIAARLGECSLVVERHWTADYRRHRNVRTGRDRPR